MHPRFIERRVKEALTDTRAVLITGPRQSGKTTLAREIAGKDMPFLTLDDATVLKAASEDPTGFVRRLDRAVIDEVQRAPALLLAIKTAVDADQRPGRFLLTGSADLMTIPTVADSLAGRMETIRLLPLAQAELRANHPDLLERAFDGEAPVAGTIVLSDDLVHAVLAGGYPEALSRKQWRRRQNWYLNYIEAIVQRDVRYIAQIEQIRLMPRLLRIIAEHSGQLVNHSGIGAPLGMNHVTTRNYTNTFESLYLIHSLQPWYTNKIKRIIKTPKLHFLDAGLLAALRDISPERVKSDRTVFGPILETFIFGEILKLASWSEERYQFFHFRDKQRNEVDVVLEDRRGRVVGIEVKASATVTSADFSGMRRLAEACGDRFAFGMVLYDHDQIVPFGERMIAAPLSCLW